MESLSGVSQIIAVAAASAAADKFSEAGRALVKARDQIREEVQKLTASSMKPIIHKLEKNQPLSLEEKDLVRAWIVGDAAAFTKKENDHREWLEEFRRLGEALSNQETLPTSLPDLMEVYGTMEEAVRLAGDIQFFLEEKERVARFEQAIQNLSASEAELLAGILQEKLTSPEM
jgi:hypothetical protein